MKNKFFQNAEVLAIFVMGALALFLGGYNTIVCGVLAGVLIGLGVKHDRSGITRAAIMGVFAAILIFIGGYIYSTFVITLPEVDVPSPDQLTLTPLLIAAVVTIATSILVSYLNTIHDDRKRKMALLGFAAVCAILFPFFDQCPTLAWNAPINFANPTIGCTTEKSLIWVNALVVVFIYAIQAMGLNIVAGYAGLLDLGYVAFFAIGAYTMGLLNSDHLVAQGILPAKITFWLVIWVSAAMAAFFGMMLGAPTLPLRGDYLAIVTLGFGEIIPIAAKNLETVRIFEPIGLFFKQLFTQNMAKIDRIDNAPDFINSILCFVGCKPDAAFNLTNGTKGISPIFTPTLPGGYAFKVGDYVPWYFLALGIMVLTAFFIMRVRDSRIGRAWVSMREDELAANSMGVNILRTKILAFIIGAMFSGFAGAFYGSYVSFIEPGSFAFDISVIVLAMVILGGSGNVPGVMLGAFLIKLTDLVVLDRVKQVVNGVIQHAFVAGADNPALGAFFARLLDATSFKIMILGLILVVMMKVRPQGLLPEQTAATKRQKPA
ncbi:MAG TPA: hypothetical protein PLJ62_02605 [Thermoflexales bacterium]|nr:hypothetical protein [Thermoflexales bacterium]HQW36318.1 hypothetical protein [Thermoflexales bacterium]HQZ21550.1 hypothetical protein [Thermoflexales bacterium]HQZ99063.1 hypothetical protein [Thermoflexales bacterium]